MKFLKAGVNCTIFILCLFHVGYVTFKYSKQPTGTSIELKVMKHLAIPKYIVICSTNFIQEISGNLQLYNISVNDLNSTTKIEQVLDNVQFKYGYECNKELCDGKTRGTYNGSSASFYTLHGKCHVFDCGRRWLTSEITKKNPVWWISTQGGHSKRRVFFENKFEPQIDGLDPHKSYTFTITAVRKGENYKFKCFCSGKIDITFQKISMAPLLRLMPCEEPKKYESCVENCYIQSFKNLAGDDHSCRFYLKQNVNDECTTQDNFFPKLERIQNRNFEPSFCNCLQPCDKTIFVTTVKEYKTDEKHYNKGQIEIRVATEYVEILKDFESYTKSELVADVASLVGIYTGLSFMGISLLVFNYKLKRTSTVIAL